MAELKKALRFGGKKFYLIYPDATTSIQRIRSKSYANGIARDEREYGRLVRVVKIKNGYAVYVRNK